MPLPFLPAGADTLYTTHRAALREHLPAAPMHLPWATRRDINAAWAAWWSLLAAPPEPEGRADQMAALAAARQALRDVMGSSVVHCTPGPGSELDWLDPLALALARAEDDGSALARGARPEANHYGSRERCSAVDSHWYEALLKLGVAEFHDTPDAPALVWRTDAGEHPVGMHLLVFRAWPCVLSMFWSPRGKTDVFEDDAFWSAGQDQALDLALRDLDLRHPDGETDTDWALA